MVTVERVGLQFLIVVLIRINVNAALPYNTFADENALNIIAQLLGKRSGGPTIIVLEKSSNSKIGLRSSDNLNEIDNEDEVMPFDDSIDETKTKKFVKEILRSTGDESDPLVQKTNDKFKKALRDRCAEYTKCESTCEPKKKKKKDCKKTCKEVYDYLMLCHPPGGKGKKKTKKTTSKPKTTKKDSCESSDGCAEKKDPCASGGSCDEPKDSCAAGDTCEQKKDSCAAGDTCEQKKDSCASDSCAESKPKDSCGQDECEKDSCAETDECTTTTRETRPPPGKGKTMPPKWRFQ